MSFTTEVKSQIAANELHPCCMKAELTAVLQMCSTMNFTSEGMHLTVKTENANTAKRVFRFLKELYQVDTQLSVIKKMKLKKNNIYVIRVKNKAMEILRDLEIMTERGLQNHPSSKMVRKECCASVGASDAVFTFEDSRIQRDFMNSLTRLDNCELANEMKSITAGKKQLEDIQWIETYRTLDSLPEKLQHVAYARKQLPEASLNELCEYCAEEFNETISKSGMKHRLAKLRELADQYRKE